MGVCEDDTLPFAVWLPENHVSIPRGSHDYVFNAALDPLQRGQPVIARAFPLPPPPNVASPPGRMDLHA